MMMMQPGSSTPRKAGEESIRSVFFRGFLFRRNELQKREPLVGNLCRGWSVEIVQVGLLRVVCVCLHCA